MYCIATKGLSHKFANNEAVLNNIDMQVPTGAIYGFLGPNGAGKTTTLKLILGLLRMQQGSVSMLGRQISTDRIEILLHVGSLIEAPSLYAHLTAKENLRVLQEVYQCPKQRIQEVLDIVGLTATGNKKAGRFSLGMKQRLSIAIALLPQPSLLILDEPTNGLDPNGIIEMRDLLKRLNKEQNMTIVISSHLLSEVEKLVTHVGIINKGRMMFQGTLDELMSRQLQSAHNLLDTSDNHKAIELIDKLGLHTYTYDNGKIVMPVISKEQLGDLNQALSQAGIKVYELTTVKNDLETIFIDLTKN